MRRLPFFKVIAIVQVAMLARRHLSGLSRDDRRRLLDLSRHPHRLTPAERAELFYLARKLEPRAFAGAAADHLSPFPLPGRVTGAKKKRR